MRTNKAGGQSANSSNTRYQSFVNRVKKVPSLVIKKWSAASSRKS